MRLRARYPTRTDFQDWIDLPDGRVVALYHECTEDPADVPRLFLEHYPDQAAFESLENDGCFGFSLNDLPSIVEKLSFWLDAYREHGCLAPPD